MANVDKFRNLKSVHEILSTAVPANIDISLNVVEDKKLEVLVGLVGMDEEDPNPKVVKALILTIQEMLSGAVSKQSLLDQAKALVRDELVTEAKIMRAEVDTDAADVNTVVDNL